VTNYANKPKHDNYRVSPASWLHANNSPQIERNLQMKRDMDFVRELLLYIENATPGRNGWIVAWILGRSQTETAYHLQLMTEAGLIQTQHIRTSSGDFWYQTAAPWSGHEFLDAAGNEPI
jgi:hypothetical protein